MPFLSFVIPVYNLEKLLVCCLDSISPQLTPDMEIIVIDDGSTDSSLAVAEAYATSHPETDIRVIHQENGGVGSARNAGLREARGEYIWFVDSDDRLEEHVLPRIVNILLREKPDIFLINYIHLHDGGLTEPNYVDQRFAGKTMRILDMPEEAASSFAVWNCAAWRPIVRRTVMVDNKITFPEQTYYEDHVSSALITHYAETIFIDSPPSYIYLHHNSSASSARNERVFQFIAIRKTCLELFRNFGWNKKYPSLFMQYVLPEPFFAMHVPPSLREKFLRELKFNLPDADVAAIAAPLGEAPFYKALHKSITAGNVRPYSLAKLHACGKHVTAKLCGLPRRLARKIFIKMYASARYILCGSHAHTPGNAGMRVAASALANIHLDIRGYRENRIYVDIGEYADINGVCVFERGGGKISFGRRCSVGGGTTIICASEEGISIGANTLLSWGCTIADNNSHSLDPDIRHNDAWHWSLGVRQQTLGAFKDWSAVKCGGVRIGENVWIGFGCAILAGASIGKGSVIGANSVVSGRVPPYCVFAGTPAKFVKLVPRSQGWRRDELVEAVQAVPDAVEQLAGFCLSADVPLDMRRIENSKIWKTLLHYLRNRLPAGSKLLVPSCGNGSLAFLLADNGYFVHATEPTELLTLAKAHLDGRSPTISFSNQLIPNDITMADAAIWYRCAHQHGMLDRLAKRMSPYMRTGAACLMCGVPLYNEALHKEPLYVHGRLGRTYEEKELYDSTPEGFSSRVEVSGDHALVCFTRNVHPKSDNKRTDL